MGGAPPLEFDKVKDFMGGAPPLESGCAKWWLGYQKAQSHHYKKSKNIKKYQKHQKMLKSGLKTTYRSFSNIFLDDSTMEKSILKVPGSIYKEKHGFQGIRKGQN